MSRAPQSVLSAIVQSLIGTILFVVVSAFLGGTDAKRVIIGALVFFAGGVVTTLLIYGRKGS